MTTTTVAAPAAIRPARESGPEPHARFRDLIAAEWIKLWSLRSTYGSLALIVASAIGFSVYAALADYRNWPSYSADRKSFFDPLRDAFPQEAYLFIILAASSIGATAVASEYASGLIRTVFAAVPARRAVVSAKLLVVGGVMLVIGIVCAAGAFAVSQAILSGRGAGWSIGHPYALRATVASALIIAISAIVGMGIGALIRNTAATIVTTASVLLLLPTAFGTNRHWQAVIYHAMPVSAWTRLIELPQFLPYDGRYPATVAGSWIVYAVWPTMAALVAIFVVSRRDL